MAHEEALRSRRSEETRSTVLDAAWELLESSGGSGVTMSAVAKAAGISRQGLYLHFPSRGQLFGALVEHIDGRLGLADSLRPMREAPDAPAALDAFADHVAGYHSRLVGVVRAVDRCRHEDDDAAQLWSHAMATWHAGCRGLTERLAVEGHLAEPWTPKTAADLMWALMSVELVDGLTGDRGWSVEELADRLRLVIRRTLCTEGR